MGVDIDAVKAKVGNGEAVFQHYLAPYHSFEYLKIGKTIKSPVRPVDKPDKKPSFNIFEASDGTFMYKDFGRGGSTGDCFALVERLLDCNFPDACAAINRDLALGCERQPTARSNGQLQLTKQPVSEPIANPFEVEYADGFTEAGAGFWQAYGIPVSLLNRHGIREALWFTANGKDGKPYPVKATAQRPIFTYPVGEDCAKIYRPANANPRKASTIKKGFQWIGTKPASFNDLFGVQQLPDHAETILLTEGYKDALALCAHGFTAVGLDNAGTKLSLAAFEELTTRCSNLVLCLDIDQRGVEASERLADEFGLPVLELPSELADLGGKDVGDYFLHGFSAEALREVLTATITAHQEELVNGSADDELSNSRSVPPVLFRSLPPLLRQACEVVPPGRQQDVMLLSSLCVLSGCFPKVRGLYDGDEVHPNLYCFVVAPPASGKGVMRYARQLGKARHDTLVAESNRLQQQYELDLEDYQQQRRTARNQGQSTEEIGAPPPKPDRQLLFIEGDSSKAGLLATLASCGGQAVIFESEADTMSSSNRQEWGKFSPQLRGAFHHESIGSTRKDETFTIERPLLSLVLSGTPSQIEPMVESLDNGLFSRFLFYVFRDSQKWRDVSPKGRGANYTQFFQDLSLKIESHIERLAVKPITFELSEAQWDRLNAWGDAALIGGLMEYGDNYAGVAKRLGLCMYRIAMVLSILRLYGLPQLPDTVECSEGDFEIAYTLASLFDSHTKIVFEQLPNKELGDLQGGIRKFFLQLPRKFSRNMARTIGTELGLAERTVSKYLTKLCKKHIKREGQGDYVKNT